MKITCIDPIQSELIAFSESCPLTIASGCSVKKFKQTLLHLLYHNLDNFKKSVVVCNQDQIEDLIKWLGKEKLSKYVLYIENNHHFNEKEQARLRIWAKKQKNVRPKSQFESLRTSLQLKEVQIKECVKHLQEKIFGDRNWLDLLDLSGYNELVHSAQMSHEPAPDNFEFTEDEYWLIKGRIKQLKNGYEKEFTDLFSQFQFNPSTFQGEEKIIQVIAQLNDFSSKTNENWHSLQGYVEKFRQKQFNQWNKKYLSLEQSLHELNLLDSEYKNISEHNYGSRDAGLSIPFYSTNKKSKDLDRVKSQLIDGFSMLLDECISCGLISRSNDYPELTLNTPIDQISSYLSSIRKELSGFKNLINQEISKASNRLNKYNSTDKQLVEIEDHIETLIMEINESKIFRASIEENALSSVKKLGFLIQLHKQVSGARDLLIKKVQFGHWIQRLANMPEKVKLIFRMLGPIPSNQWLETFDTWYFKKAALNKLELSFLNLQKYSQEYHEILLKFRNSILNKFEESWLRKRTLAVERLARKDKKLYIQFFKKNTLPQISWDQILSGHFNFITDIYPIVVINQQVLNDFKVPGENLWDTGIQFPEEIIQEDGLTWLTQSCNHTVSFVLKSAEGETELQIEGKDLENDVPVIPLLPELVEFDKDKLSNSSNRLLFAKIIAKHIVQLTQSCQIFQLRDQIIVSFLSKSKNKMFLKYLDGQGIKELNPNESIELTIQDSLIDVDRQLLVFTQFNLIDYKSFESFEWQTVILNYLKEYGATIHNLKSENDLFEWGKHIRKICDTIAKPKDSSLITSE